MKVFVIVNLKHKYYVVDMYNFFLKVMVKVSNI
jgi:hypothetical protein